MQQKLTDTGAAIGNWHRCVLAESRVNWSGVLVLSEGRIGAGGNHSQCSSLGWASTRVGEQGFTMSSSPPNLKLNSKLWGLRASQAPLVRGRGGKDIQ